MRIRVVALKYERVRAPAALPDAAQAMVETVRESCRAWERVPDAIRKTLALAVVDEEVGELVARYERYRRAEIAALAQRVVDGGVLGDDATVDHAAAVLALHTSFAAFDGLRSPSARRALGLRSRKARGAK